MDGRTDDNDDILLLLYTTAETKMIAQCEKGIAGILLLLCVAEEEEERTMDGNVGIWIWNYSPPATNIAAKPIPFQIHSVCANPIICG